MDSIINSIKSLFTTYGFRASAVIVATIALVNLIKIPIVKKAKKVEKERGVDKSIVTRFITLLPILVAFVLETLITLTLNGFNFGAVDYGVICSKSALYGALAVATYEGVKKQLEAYATKKNDDKTLVLEKLEEKQAVVAFNANN